MVRTVRVERGTQAGVYLAMKSRYFDVEIKTWVDVELTREPGGAARITYTVGEFKDSTLVSPDDASEAIYAMTHKKWKDLVKLFEQDDYDANIHTECGSSSPAEIELLHSEADGEATPEPSGVCCPSCGHRFVPEGYAPACGTNRGVPNHQ